MFPQNPINVYQNYKSLTINLNSLNSFIFLLNPMLLISLKTTPLTQWLLNSNKNPQLYSYIFLREDSTPPTSFSVEKKGMKRDGKAPTHVLLAPSFPQFIQDLAGVLVTLPEGHHQFDPHQALHSTSRNEEEASRNVPLQLICTPTSQISQRMEFGDENSTSLSHSKGKTSREHSPSAPPSSLSFINPNNSTYYPR